MVACCRVYDLSHNGYWKYQVNQKVTRCTAYKETLRIYGMSGIMVGTINLIHCALGKLAYHMACRYPRKSQEFVICVVHNPSHVRYCKHHMPCTRKST